MTLRIADVVILAATLVSVAVLSACTPGQGPRRIGALDDARQARIGVMTGSTGEGLARKRFPEATVKSFDDVMDAVAALKSDQIEAVITGYPTAMSVTKKNRDLTYLSDAVDHENTAIALPKGNAPLLATLNEFITALTDDGTLRGMKKRWFKSDNSPYEEVTIPVPEGGEVLRVGVSATREPFCFLDAAGVVTGHDGELARRVARKLGRRLQFVDMKFSALVTALQAGKIDLIITGMTATAERANSVDFTQPYFQNSQVMIVRTTEAVAESPAAPRFPLRSVKDLRDKRIGVLLGSVHDTYATKAFPGATILQYKSPSELILAVRSDKVDAAIYTTETLAEILRGDMELRVLGDTLFSVSIGMGFPRENGQLREKFNAFLKTIRETGEYQDMVDRWLTRGETAMPEIAKGKTSGTLVVGTVSDKGLPFTVVRDGKLIGFDIEMVRRFAACSGLDVKFVDMEFGSLIIAAAARKIDMVASTLMITEERRKQIDFSDAYLRLKASAFALTKNVGEPPAVSASGDLAGKKMAVYAGTVHDAFAQKRYPRAEIQRYNSTSDMILALKTKKVDVALFDLYSATVLMKKNPEIVMLADDVLDLPVGMGFSKSHPDLREQFNAFLKTAKAGGQFDTIYARWFLGDAENASVPRFSTAKRARVVVIGVAVGDLPYCAYVRGEYAGFDIELLRRFAHHANLELKIVTMDFGALVAALASGKVDMISDGICITEERAKQVAFSESYLSMKTAMVALGGDAGGHRGGEHAQTPVTFLESVANSFQTNIVQEKRYLLILDGLKTTALISILATVFGSMLGGLICYMRMAGTTLLVLPAKLYISLLRGTPVLVVLMLIFYVVFASVNIDPVIVAVMAFGLNFAAYVSEMFRTGIEGVDRGQTEAGIAMGFTKLQTFIHIVMPQAAWRILPVYKGEVISLVKMTSIVGYIAVQDLTKASDIIRSRTFDAFFPLIMVAVLYFMISWLLMAGLGYAERLVDPTTRTQRG